MNFKHLAHLKSFTIQFDIIYDYFEWVYKDS